MSGLYKAGDKVRCINNDCNSNVVTVGRIYEVKRADGAGRFVNIVEGDNGQTDTILYAHRFEPVDTPAPAPIKEGTQLAKVRNAALSVPSITLQHLADVTGASEAAASARLRDLRKLGYTVDVTKPKGEAQRRYTVRVAETAAA